MSNSPRTVTGLLILLCGACLVVGLGCGGSVAPPAGSAPGDGAGPSRDGAPPVAAGAWKGKELGRAVTLETADDRRRVRVDARVCLREGQYGLECLLCREHTKEYESILATAANAEHIHAGLLVCGAQPGSPVRFEPELKSPTGSVIKVTLEYEAKGKLVSVPAQKWVMNIAKKKELTDDWVFAGSLLLSNPEGAGKERIYAATSDGAYICVTNVPSAMLDLPIKSSNNPDDRAFAPYTERIPPLETRVSVILEAAAGAKKGSAK
jgi:hypothetical protein